MSYSVSPFEPGETEMPRNQHTWPAGHTPLLGTCSYFCSLPSPGARDLLSLLIPWCIHSFCQCQEPIWVVCSSPQPQPQLAKSQSSECTHNITVFSLPGTGTPVLILLLFTHQPTVVCRPRLLKVVIAEDIHSLPVAQARGYLALLFLGVLSMSDIIGCLLYSEAFLPWPCDAIQASPAEPPVPPLWTPSPPIPIP